MAFDKLFGIGIMMSVMDRVTGPMRKIQASMGATQASAQRLGVSMVKVGAVMTAAGAAMTGFAVATIKSTAETQRALGELASLGIKDLDAIENAAQEFSNQWSGVTKAAFITAAYDIKSGIETLSDSAVGEYTKIAALTGKATKATVGEMTDLFKTGYGIYKNFYSEMSDFDFGKMFSGGIAQAVQSFATTGPEMKAFIETLGATGTTRGIEMSEQFAAGGMLQATMSGAEAGTAYQSFLFAAAEAGQKLGLNFLDANKQLLPMADILKIIRGRFGPVIDAVENIQLKEAFGRKEAVKPVELLIGKISELEKYTNNISKAMAGGTAKTLEMAKAMEGDPGARWALFMQRISNTMEVLGNTILPLTMPILDWVSNMALAFQKWAAAHPVIVKIGMSLLAFGGAILTILGILTMVGGAMLIAIPSLKALGFALFALKYYAVTAFAPLIASAGPVLLVIAAIAGAAYLIYRNWDVVSKFLKTVWSGIVTGFNWAINLIVGYYRWLWDFTMSIPRRLYEAGRNMILEMVNGIKSVIELPYRTLEEGLNRLRQLFPFSPAKEGPLRDIDKSGYALGATFAQGIRKSAATITTAAWASIGAAGIAFAAPGDLAIPLVPEYMAKTPAILTAMPAAPIKQAPVFLGPPKSAFTSDVEKIKKGGPLDIPEVSGLGGGYGGPSVTNNYYTIHVEQGSVIDPTGAPAGADFDERVEAAFERLFQKLGIGKN